MQFVWNAAVFLAALASARVATPNAGHGAGSTVRGGEIAGAAAGSEESRPQTVSVDARELSEKLQSPLEELSREQNTSQEQSKAAFDKAFQAGAEPPRALLEGQEELNATRNAPTQVSSTNATAGGARASSLPRVGLKRKEKKGGSVFPMSVGEVVKKPRQVFNAMSSKVNALAARLERIKLEGVLALKMRKEEYERRLKDQASATRAIKSANAELSASIGRFRMHISALRVFAEGLQRENAHLAADLQRINSNMSIALEFADGTLAADYNNASEVQILAELAEKDAKEAEARDHQMQLGLVSGMSRRVSMFQLDEGAPSVIQADAESLLTTMISSLGDLKVQQNKSEAMLNSSFEQLFQAGAKAQESLLAEQAKLNADLKAEQELSDKLALAVELLQENRKFLQQRVSAVRLFAHRLGTTNRHGKLKVTRVLPNVTGTSVSLVSAQQQDNSTRQQPAHAPKLNGHGSSVPSKLASRAQRPAGMTHAQRRLHSKSVHAEHERLQNGSAQAPQRRSSSRS